MRCDLGSHALNYELRGPEDAPVVVLGHCFGSNLHCWDRQMPALTAYRTLRYDTRGHGASDTPPGPYRLDDLGNDVIALMGRLDLGRVHYAGISMGGMIGQNIALRFPERVATLGLITTTCTYREPGREVWRDWQRRVTVAGSVEVLAESMLTRWFTDAAVARDDQAVRYMREAFRSMSADAFAWIADGIINDFDYCERLGGLEVPALIVASPDDPGVPREISELMLARLPNAALHWLSPARHLATLEHPERFNQLLVQFLAEHS